MSQSGAVTHNTYRMYLNRSRTHARTQLSGCGHDGRLLVRGKNMAENDLGSILLLIYQSSILNIRKSVLKIESIVSISQEVSLQINKSRPRLVATFQQG